jgi:hypothetical protein
MIPYLTDRHGHWSLSQLQETESSEPEYEQLEFSFEQQPSESTQTENHGSKQYRRLNFCMLARATPAQWAQRENVGDGRRRRRGLQTRI